MQHLFATKNLSLFDSRGIPGIPTQPPNREFQLHAETIAWCCCGAANGLKLAMRKDSVMTSCSAGPHGADIPRGSIPKKHKEMIGHMWYAFPQPFIRQSKMQGMRIQMAVHFVYLQPRHLHFGRCSPLSSPPCLQSRALVIQPTHLPPVTILRSYPWIHDQFSKKMSFKRAM